jgi:hypothetical protein
MRRCGLALALATAAAAALGACHPVEHKNPMAKLFDDGPYRTVDRLTCPDSLRELTRISQAADGKSCTYDGPDDEQIELSLLQLGGRDPQSALADLQQNLKAEAGPPGGGKAEAAGNRAGDEDADDDHDTDSGPHRHAHIDLPGLHIDADNDKASVHMPGVSVNAKGDEAQVQTGWGPYPNLQIDANNGHAEIHGGAVTDTGARLVYLYASDMPGPQGYRTVGYVARGPRAGPLVVGVFKSREKDNDHARLTPDGLERLVRINVRG